MQKQLLEFIEVLKSDESIQVYDEAATKLGIILNFLHILGWNTFVVDEVYPEYSVGKGRIDFSLRVDGINKVFLEAKKVKEELENKRHQQQLLNYSFQHGVKLAILTNGVKWWFYLPLLEGNWEQRKFYSIDIYQQKIEDIAIKFIDFLAKENIANGKALDNAEAAHKSQQRQKILQEKLPEAWNKLISDPNELLVDLISETVEGMGGYRDDNTVKQFLSNHNNQLLIDTYEPKEQIEGIQKISPKKADQLPNSSHTLIPIRTSGGI